MICLKPLRLLLQLQCPAGAPLHCAVCHTFSSSFLRSGSSCVLHLTSLITSFVPLHFVSFTILIIAYAARCRKQLTKQCFSGTPTASANPLFITLHFAHYVIHSLQSGAIHPLPSVVVLALRPPAALRGIIYTKPTLIRLAPYATCCPFTVCPSQPVVALLATPAGGTRSPFRRSSSIPFDGEQPCFVWSGLPHS